MTRADVKHLYELNTAVRKAQKLYFKTRKKEHLIDSKRLEVALDKFLAIHRPELEEDDHCFCTIDLRCPPFAARVARLGQWTLTERTLPMAIVVHQGRTRIECDTRAELLGLTSHGGVFIYVGPDWTTPASPEQSQFVPRHWELYIEANVDQNQPGEQPQT